MNIPSTLASVMSMPNSELLKILFIGSWARNVDPSIAETRPAEFSDQQKENMRKYDSLQVAGCHRILNPLPGDEWDLNAASQDLAKEYIRHYSP